MRVAKLVKRTALLGLRQAGAFAAVHKSIWRQQRLLILCYHGISQRDEHEWNPELFMPPELFEQRLKLLRDGGYSVLPLAEAVRRLYERTLPPRSVAITFDDGFANFRSLACPLLGQYGFPASVYLTTYYVGFNRPLFNLICSYMFWKRRHARSYPVPEAGWTTAPDLSTVKGRDAARSAVEEFVGRERRTAQEKDQLAIRLADVLGFDYADAVAARMLHLMKPAEVAELPRAGISVELHTHRHRVPAEEQLFRDEVTGNAARIRSLTGIVPRHFCYPSGITSPDSMKWLRELGVCSGTTCVPGLATAAVDRLSLPRFVDTTMQSAVEFEAWLTGIAQLLPRRHSLTGLNPPAALNEPVPAAVNFVSKS